MNRPYIKGSGRPYSKTQRRLARRVSRLEKKSKAQELKTHDINRAMSGQSTTMTFQCLNLIQQGDESGMREGLKLNAVKLYSNFSILGNASAASTQLLRVIIFVDRDGDGATPSATDLLESEHYLSLKKHESRHRFHIKYDKTFKVSGTITENEGAKLPRVHLKFGKKGMTCFYQGTGNSVADTDTNSLWIATISSEATNTPSLAYNLRMRYYG